MGPITIYHEADLHVTDGPRFQDHLDVLGQAVEAARKAEPDLVVIAGDLTNQAPRKATPRERNALVDHVLALAKLCPVVIVRGNHDYPGDWLFLNELGADHPVRYLERPELLTFTMGKPGDLFSAQQCHVLAVPYPERGWLAPKVAGGREAVNQAVREGLKGLLLGMAHRCTAGVVRIGVAHCNVIGTTLDNGQPLIGDEVEIGETDLLEHAPDLWCLGHIHKPQDFQDGRIVYSGEPMKHKHGAPGDRSVCVHQVGAGEPVRTKRIKLGYRDLVTLDLWFGSVDERPPALYLMNEGKRAESPMMVMPAADVHHAEVRVRLRYQEEHGEVLDRAKLEQELLDAGAHRVKVEASAEPAVKVRAPEIVEAQETPDKLAIFLRERGKEIGDPVVDALVREHLALLETREPGDVLAEVQALVREVRT